LNKGETSPFLKNTVEENRTNVGANVNNKCYVTFRLLSHEGRRDRT